MKMIYCYDMLLLLRPERVSPPREPLSALHLGRRALGTSAAHVEKIWQMLVLAVRGEDLLLRQAKQKRTSSLAWTQGTAVAQSGTFDGRLEAKGRNIVLPDSVLLQSVLSVVWVRERIVLLLLDEALGLDRERRRPF